MIIAHCLEYPIAQHGGVEVLVRELVAGLSTSHTLLLVSADTAETIQSFTQNGQILDHFSWPTETACAQDAHRLAVWLRKHRVDIAHFHFGGTYQWRARSLRHCPIPIVSSAGIPCVSTNHGAFSIFECVGSQRPLWYKVAALPLFWPAKVRQVMNVHWEATVSQHDLRAVRRRFFPVRNRFIQIYHSKLDGTKALHAQKKKSVLCLGTIGPRKGQNFLAEAFGQIASRFPEWQLILAGRHADPVTVRLVEDAIKRYGFANQCQIVPVISDQEAEHLLETSAIFAFPSTHEGLGLALQEAMFAGAACVGSNAGGITDLIEHNKTGLLVRPGHADDLASALEKLMTSAELRQQLGRQGRDSIKEKMMTCQQMIVRHIELYEKTIAQSKVGSQAPHFSPMSQSLLSRSIGTARILARTCLPERSRKKLGAFCGRQFQTKCRPVLGLLFDVFQKKYRTGSCEFEIPREQTTCNFRACFFLDDYENEERELISKYIRPDDDVLEYGACIGVVSCTTNKLLEPGRKHIVVEGNPLLISSLAKNRVLNGCSFEIVFAAASGSEARMDFHIHPEFIVGDSTRDVGSVRFEVQGYPLALAARNHGRCSVLILDIEGAELELLESGLDELRHFRIVILELHKYAYGEEGLNKCHEVLESSSFMLKDRAGDTEVWIK